jgi:hypothetical protein
MTIATAVCRRTVLLVLLAFLGGCSFLSAAPDPTRFFVLASIAELPEQAPAPEPDPSFGTVFVGVGPVTLPQYLLRPQFVHRVATNRVDIDEFVRWAEPLDNNFARALAQNLRGLLGTDRIVAFPWLAASDPDYQVRVDVVRFEATTGGQAELLARWTVRKPGALRAFVARESRFTRLAASATPDAEVLALSEALADFSREIADAIQEAHRVRPGTGS